MTFIGHPFLFLIFVFVLTPSLAQFDFKNEKIQETYKQIINLETKKAQRNLAILSDSSTQPKNGIVYLLENYLDIIPLLTVQDEGLYQNLKENEQKRIKQLKTFSSKSPFYLYSQADIKLQWAFVELAYGDYINGFFDLKKANDLIAKNIEKHPNFHLNGKVKGLIDLLTEAAPEEANIALIAAGLSRSNSGKSTLIRTAVFSPLFEEEINIYLSFIDAYIKNQDELALKKIEKVYLKNPNNLFAQFTYLNILSKLKKYQAIVDQLDTNKLHLDTNYLYIPYLDYVEAESLMLRLKLDKAKLGYKRFIEDTTSSTFHAIASFNLALIYASQNQLDSCQIHLSTIKSLEISNLYLDKYAIHVSTHTNTINSSLALSRILFDGGFIDSCYTLLTQTTPFENSEFETERLYRLGRCAWQLNKNDQEALTYFLQASNISVEESPYYFGAYATYYSGYIYQKKNSNKDAQKLFKKVRHYKNHFYASGLIEKANSKLKEIEN